MAIRKDVAGNAAKAVANAGLRWEKPRDLEQLNFKFSAAAREALKEHFERRGLTLSAGIRSVLLEYMEAEHLR